MPQGFRDDAHAVVIGINQYQDPRIPNLRYAAADALAFHAVLTDPALGRFRPENVTLLLDAHATERRIRSAIGTELPRRASADHTVCVFFAGHGAPVINARTGSRDGLEKYLLPHDALADDLRSSAIAMDDIHKFFEWIDTSQVIFFIDSCYSGVAGGRTFGPTNYAMRASLTDEFLDVLAGEGRLVVTACAMNEVALETAEIGHGLFTHYLIEGLKGPADADEDGLVTVDELYDYVYRNVERQARELGGSMNPLRKGFVKGTVYLTHYETPVLRRVREAANAADAAFRRNDLDQASRLWQEILSLDPAHELAQRGLATIAERQATERTQREEAERQRRDALHARQRVLLRHRKSGALSVQQFALAMDLAEKDIAGLTRTERHQREFVDALIDGSLTVQQYVRSLELLAAEPSSHHDLPSPFTASAPPQGSAPSDSPATASTAATIEPPRETGGAAPAPMPEASPAESRLAEHVTKEQDEERDAAADRGVRSFGRELWTVVRTEWRGIILWIVLSLGGFLGGVFLMSFLSEPALNSPPFIGMAGVGALTGLLQWLYLRWRVPVSARWILWTALLVQAAPLLVWSATQILPWLGDAVWSQAYRQFTLAGIVISFGTTLIGRRCLRPLRGLAREVLVWASPWFVALAMTPVDSTNRSGGSRFLFLAIMWLCIYSVSIMARVRAVRLVTGSDGSGASRRR